MLFSLRLAGCGVLGRTETCNKQAPSCYKPDTKLESSEKRKPWLRKCICLPGLYTSLWASSLCNDGCERPSQLWVERPLGRWSWVIQDSRLGAGKIRQLRGWEHWLHCQKLWVQFLAPTCWLSNVYNCTSKQCIHADKTHKCIN